jgi:cyclohexyl-isocyanide hydratase
MALEIGFLVFPKLQQLDLTGPYEVFAALPGTRVHLIWKTLAPVISSSGLSVVPTVTMQDCPRLDVVCVCGGAGIDPLLEDEETLAFLRSVVASGRFARAVEEGATDAAAGVVRLAIATHGGGHGTLLRAPENLRAAVSVFEPLAGPPWAAASLFCS